MALTKITGEGVGAVDNLTVDTNTLHVDAANNRVGVGTASPSEPFHIVGASGAATDMQIQGGDDTNSVRLFMGGNTNPLNGRIVYSTASDFMAFSTGGDQRVRVDSDGLKFGSDTAAANALSDYEEGTWTPTVAAGTIDIQYAVYTKIGRKVTVSVYITQFNDRSASNHIIFSGLPFASGTSYAVSSIFGRFVNQGGNSLMGYQPNGSSEVQVYSMVKGATYQAIGHNDLNSASALMFLTHTYMTA